MGAEFFHADRRTEMTKLMVAFRNFANALKNGLYSERRKLAILNEGGVRLGGTREELQLDLKECMPHQGTLSRSL